MKLTVEQFVTVVRALPLSAAQLAAAEAAFAASAPSGLPNELICREVLTEFQARQILAGRGADLTVGRYLLLSELGAGGMGTVFKARDTAMDRVVALKLIRDERLANPAALARFQQEVRAAARLAHPNIVRAYDAGTADGRHFLVTELVTGHDLGHELARRGALPAGEACEYARQAAVGLQHAHENGLTHRDIKPSNLLFSTAERLVKIADFGLARVGDAGANGLTADGSVMGTPDYIAPEQASSATSADIRSDLYSLGSTLYHFLTGRVPFPADSAYAKLLAHTRDEPEPLDDACPGLNPALVAVVQKLMSKNPAERYQTPLEAAEALIPFCPKPRTGTTSVVSRPVTAPPVPVAPSKASASNPVVLPTPATQNNSGRKTLPPPLPVIPDAFAVPEPQPQPAVKSNKVLALVGVGGGVLALVVLVVVLARGGNTNTNTNNNDVKVAVPVSVSVKLDDWAKAREPGVILVLGDRTMALADFARVELPPGRYTVVAKKDGKEIEARAFDVKDGDAGKAVAARVVAIPEPDRAPGELHRWTVAGLTLDIVATADGKRFAATTRDTIGPSWSPNFDRAVYLLDGDRSLQTRLEGGGGSRLSLLPGTDTVTYFQGRGSDASGHGYWDLKSLDVMSLKEANTTHALPQTKGLFGREMSLYTVSSDGGRALVSCYAFSGPTPLSVTGTIYVYGLDRDKDGKFALKERRQFQGEAARFDPTGERAFVLKGPSVTLQDEASGRVDPVEYSTTSKQLSCLAVSSDGTRIAAGDETGKVYFWSRSNGTPTSEMQVHSKQVHSIVFTQDGKRAVTVSDDCSIRVLDTSSGKELHQYKHDGPVYALAMSPGGKRVLTGSADKTIRLWQLPP